MWEVNFAPWYTSALSDRILATILDSYNSYLPMISASDAKNESPFTDYAMQVGGSTYLQTSILKVGW